MGVYSARGMGPAQPIPGYKVFKGSAARMNAQTEISALIAGAGLSPDQREFLERLRAKAWKAGGTPQEVYRLIYQTLKAYHAKRLTTGSN